MKITYIDTAGMTDKETRLSLSVAFGDFATGWPSQQRRTACQSKHHTLALVAFFCATARSRMTETHRGSSASGGRRGPARGALQVDAGDVAAGGCAASPTPRGRGA